MPPNDLQERTPTCSFGIRGHFEREAYLSALFPGSIFVAPVLLAIVLLCACNPIQAARVDACLDRGGSYDYEAEACDLEENHPVP